VTVSTLFFASDTLTSGLQLAVWRNLFILIRGLKNPQTSMTKCLSCWFLHVCCDCFVVCISSSPHFYHRPFFPSAARNRFAPLHLCSSTMTSPAVTLFVPHAHIHWEFPFPPVHWFDLSQPCRFLVWRELIPFFFHFPLPRVTTFRSMKVFAVRLSLSPDRRPPVPSLLSLRKNPVHCSPPAPLCSPALDPSPSLGSLASPWVIYVPLPPFRSELHDFPITRF